MLAVVTTAAALPAIFGNNPSRRFGGVCLLFLGLTAGMGAARFGGYEVALFHDSMAWTSRMIVLPALGAVFVALGLGYRIIRPYWYGLCFLLAGIGWALPPSLGLIPSLAAMAAMLIVAVRSLKGHPKTAAVVFLGVATMLIAGLVIGTSGDVAGLKRVDLFHYALAVAHACFAFAMIKLDESQSKTTANVSRG